MVDSGQPLKQNLNQKFFFVSVVLYIFLALHTVLEFWIFGDLALPTGGGLKCLFIFF